MVYDDSLYRDFGSGLEAAADKRAFLLDTAQPFYVNRFTGAVIRGPIGESVAP